MPSLFNRRKNVCQVTAVGTLQSAKSRKIGIRDTIQSHMSIRLNIVQRDSLLVGTSGETMMNIKGEEGNWLLIVNNQVVASDSNCGKILKLAEKYKGKDLLITKVLSADAFY